MKNDGSISVKASKKREGTSNSSFFSSSSLYLLFCLVVFSTGMFPSCYCVSDCIVVIVGDDTAVTTGNSCHSVILEHERKRNGTCAAGSFSLSILISTRFAEMERHRAQSRSFFVPRLESLIRMSNSICAYTTQSNKKGPKLAAIEGKLIGNHSRYLWHVSAPCTGH